MIGVDRCNFRAAERKLADDRAWRISPRPPVGGDDAALAHESYERHEWGRVNGGWLR